MSSIHFREIGHGFPVVLIHGFCETHQIWDGFAEKLSEDFRVIVPDLPGFGKSQLLSVPFSVEGVAEALLHFLAELKLEKFSLVGHSLGGYVSLAMGQLNPDKVKSIILFQSTPFADTEEKRTNRNRVMQFVKENGVKPFIDTFVTGLFHNKQHPAIPGVHRLAMQTQMDTLLTYTTAMRDRPSSIAFLESSLLPCLVIAGEQDSIISVESLRDLEKIGRVKMKTLKDVAHMGMFEDPPGSIELIKDFLIGEEV